MNPNNDRTTRSKPPGRKPYVKPRLTSYGHVKDIVKGGGGTKSDAGRATRSCWIAEALYGVDAPRTLLVRSWLAEAYDRRSRWSFLIRFYARYGRTAAGLIRRRHLPSWLFVPLFDYLVVKANDDTARMLKLGIKN